MVEDTGIICSGLWTGTGRRCAATGRTVAGGELSGIFLLLLAVAHLSVGFVDSIAFWALYLAWKIFGNIEKDHAFTTENAEYMGRISFLAAADAVVLLVGNVLFLLIGMNHPGILLLCFVVTLIGIGFSVAAAALSHLIRKAADLQDQSDWTI